jgi:hypothetical protein
VRRVDGLHLLDERNVKAIREVLKCVFRITHPAGLKCVFSVEVLAPAVLLVREMRRTNHTKTFDDS